MPLCQGCGASFDDTYKFCPHCGRARPEPQAIDLNVQVAPVRYEEAVLKMEVVGTAELTEPPFDRRPSGLMKLLGEGGRNWTQITTFRLLVDSHHPERGEYTAHQSATFRGFATDDLKLPDSVTDRWEYKGWVENVFRERKLAWESVTRYLVQEGWEGLTKAASDWKEPFPVTPGYNSEGDMLILYYHTLQIKTKGQIGTIHELTYWRYRRIAV